MDKKTYGFAADSITINQVQHLWIVGQIISAHFDIRNKRWINDTQCWEFQGVFDDKEKAIAACTTEYHFVMGAFELNQQLPDEQINIPEGETINGIISFCPLRK